MTTSNVSQLVPWWRKKWLLVGSAVCLVITLIFIWLQRRPMPPDLASKQLLLNAMGRSHNELSSFIWPEEVSENSLTNPEIHEILEKVVRPNLLAAGLKNNAEVFCNLHGTQGFSDAVIHTPSGRVNNFGVAAYSVDGIPRSFLGDAISSSWSVRYMSETDCEWNRDTMNKAFASGLERDKEKLRALGYRTMYKGDPQTGDVIKIALF
jgi:hypothetical protein